MARAELITDEAARLGDLVPGWDALAVACAKPFSSPAWMLAWWRRVAPPGSALRVVAVRDGQDVIAVAPFFSDPSGRYRLLGRGTSYRPEPIAVAGREREAAATVASVLAAQQDPPQLVSMEGISPGSPWPGAMAEAWPGRPAWVHGDRTISAPTIDLRDRTYEDWLASRPRRFREEARRRRRRLDERGGTFRLAATEEERTRGLAAFARLHYARWRARGGTKALDRSVELLLADAAAELGPAMRFRLWTIEVDDDIISAHVFLAAGGEVTYWLGGFDEAWSAFAPANLTILEALRHAFESGDHRLDLGGGDQEYKRRLADGADVLEWWTLLPRGTGYPMARLRLAPGHVYRSIADRVPAPAKERLERTARNAWRRFRPRP